MLSASFNQPAPNQGLRYATTISDNSMNCDYSQFGYDNLLTSSNKSDMLNSYFNHQNHFMPNLNGNHSNNHNQDSKMYAISEVDSLFHSSNNSHHQMIANDYLDSRATNNKDVDIVDSLSSRLQSFGIRSNCGMSRSNSAHNSPFDNRVTPRHFPQSTSNTPLPMASRVGRDVDMMRGNAPIMQLFPNNNPSSVNAAAVGVGYPSSVVGRQSPVELIEYQSIASKMGFLVGQDLEEVLNRSAAMKNSNSSRISNFFKHKHGTSGSHNNSQKQYLVLGVRVPSKEHVSEIVGKEGKKIKTIRQTTGALIATPNEKEDHVFLVEAVPETAIKVGQMIQQLAEQITRNKLGNVPGLIGDRPRSPPMLGSRTPLATATIGVPQRLVGKVIGTQGSIITTVQKETGTEIKSPPKDELRAPDDTADFEISVYESGAVNSYETAWLQIHRAQQLIAHLVMRVWEQQPRNSTPSSDEGGNNGGSGNLMNCGGTGSVPEWIWPKVSPMDDGDAKEIIDRILRSSKAKITPSTSSTEGGNFDGMLGPQCNSVSPPFSIAMLDGGKQQQQTGYHSMHNTPFKMFGGRSMDEDTGCWGRPPSFGDCLSDPQQRKSVNGMKDSSSVFYPPQYFNGGNDSAFYDQQPSYYPNVYMPSTDSPYDMPISNSHHQQSANGGSSWSKTGLYTPSANNNPIPQSYPEDSRLCSLRYLWKSPTSTGSSVDDQNENAAAKLIFASRFVPNESIYGTIGDGRKRLSAASNSGDDREDL